MNLMNDDRLTKKIYNWDYNMSNGWCSELKKVFDKLELPDYFLDQRVCDLMLVKSKIRGMMEMKWKLEVNSKPKLRTYRLFKNEFKISDSVFINDRTKRALISQFRFGILPLRIETGRWYRGIDIEQRLCEICRNGDIEDEIHFLIKCNVYSHARNRLFEKCLTKNVNFMSFDDQDKLIFIANNMERDLANFLLISWNERRNYLYS